MAFKLAEAYVEIDARDRKYQAGQSRVRASLGRLGGAFKAFGIAAAAAFVVAGVAAAKLAKTVISLAQAQEDAEIRVASIIKATGGASGIVVGPPHHGT